MTDPIISFDLSAECSSGSSFCSLNPPIPPANVSSVTAMATQMAVMLATPEPIRGDSWPWRGQGVLVAAATYYNCYPRLVASEPPGRPEGTRHAQAAGS